MAYTAVSDWFTANRHVTCSGAGLVSLHTASAHSPRAPDRPYPLVLTFSAACESSPVQARDTV